MKKLIIILLFTTAVVASFARDLTYISDRIDCPEENERFVFSLYHDYLNLLANTEVKKGELAIHKIQVQNRDGFVLSGWAFYLTPNEMTGFDFTIPENLMSKEGDFWINTSTLTIESRDFKQGQETIVLKRKEDSNQTVDTTPVSAPR